MRVGSLLLVILGHWLMVAIALAVVLDLPWACAFAPLMRRLHQRWQLLVVVAVVLAVGLVDLARFAADVAAVGNLNFARVLLACRTGVCGRPGRRS